MYKGSCNGEPYVKKDDKDGFDVPMDCYDGAEVCKMIVTYLLIQPKVVIAKKMTEFIEIMV